MSTRGNLEEVETGDIQECDTRDVTECPADAIVLIVDNHGTTALNATSVPHLTLASTEAT